MTAFPLLFSPVRLGRLTLANRVVMAAMETNLADPSGAVTEALVAHYRRRAAGGAGMVTVEYACVEQRHGRGSSIQLALDEDRLVAGHARLAAAIADQGAVACLQLHHAGRQTSPRFLDGRQPVAPSAHESWMFRTTPRALDDAEVEALVGQFADAAARAVAAGYAAIELHGAHGYLLGQFLSPWTNRRDDRWGGDAQRRLAFPSAVVRRVKAAIGDRPLVYRLSAEEFVPGGIDPDEAAAAACALVAAGADAIHVSTGIAERLDTNVDPIATAEGWRLGHARRIRRALAGAAPVIGVGVIRSPAMAEAAIAEGSADLIALGRALLADPDWPRKAAAGRVAAIRPCTSCNWCIQRLGQHGGIGCAENPAVGRDQLDGPAIRTNRPRAVVAGGGPGGMAGAVLLAEAGWRVTLLEASVRLGGGIDVSARPPFKDKLLWYRDHLVRRLAETGVDVQCGTPADAAGILAHDPAFVLVATGSLERDGEVAPGGIVVPAYDVLAGDRPLGPGPILVYGGGETGCETAELAAAEGWTVHLVTRSTARQLARSAELVYRRTLLQRLHAHPRIELLAETRLARVEGDQALLEGPGGARRRIACGQVLLAQGRRPADGLATAMAAAGVPHAVIGDARRGGRIGDAVNDAWDAIRGLPPA
ncbi:NADH oxidase [Allostella humosa]|nr:FAD-dependent oxidoreductase [Stella humosa]BBK34891.1 NADH oxidase [Stella humosa]